MPFRPHSLQTPGTEGIWRHSSLSLYLVFQCSRLLFERSHPFLDYWRLITSPGPLKNIGEHLDEVCTAMKPFITRAIALLVFICPPRHIPLAVLLFHPPFLFFLHLPTIHPNTHGRGQQHTRAQTYSQALNNALSSHRRCAQCPKYTHSCEGLWASGVGLSH